MFADSSAYGFISFRGLAPACILALGPLVATGCGHETKIDFTTVSKPPVVQVINPPVRTIVRVVGQPSFIESLRAHFGLSQTDRLYREMECGHWRQGEEGRHARDPVRARTGGGFRDEEGDCRARQATHRAGPQAGRRWPMPTLKSAQAGLAESKAILANSTPMVERWDSEVKRLQE